jgi:hypothetical protein
MVLQVWRFPKLEFAAFLLLFLQVEVEQEEEGTRRKKKVSPFLQIPIQDYSFTKLFETLSHLTLTFPPCCCFHGCEVVGKGRGRQSVCRVGTWALVRQSPK